MCWLNTWLNTTRCGGADQDGVPSGLDGRERWRNIGLIEPRELREAIARYDDQRDKAR